ncbi:MAG TPA: hypothetical protein VJ997_14855, partial [Longimicrobiales bacterium]|nr:hypothetical protein [Longimicrobiales bacterium]
MPVLLLSASLVFVGLLGLQAYRSERAREAGARNTLLGYAQVVAFQVASEAYQSLNREIPSAFAALDRAPRGARGVEVLLASPGEKERCAAPLDSAGGRWSFRVPLPASGQAADLAADLAASEWFGDPPVPAARARVLATALSSLEGLSQDGGSYGVVLLDDGEAPWVVALAVRWRPSPENTSVYGFRTCLEGTSDPLFRQAMLARAALPPALTGGAPPDTLFAARAVREAGGPVWSSPGSGDAFQAGDTASLRLWPPFDALTVEVALRPSIRARLVPSAG